MSTKSFHMIHTFHQIFVVLLSAFASSSALASDLPVKITAYDTNIHYIGRFDKRDEKGPICNWPACSAVIRFNANAINLDLTESGVNTKDISGVNQWQVILDGQPIRTLTPKQGRNTYEIARDLPPGDHQLEIFRRTESALGIAQFGGFQLSEGGQVLAPKPSSRRIEVIGDSISCGYGNEARSASEPFSAETENAYATYGAIAARALNAEYISVCWTGMRVLGEPGFDRLYAPTTSKDSKDGSDFSTTQPQAIVINLGTNDFTNANPDEKQWADNYKALIARVRSLFPQAIIYLSTSPMLTDYWPVGQKARSTHSRYVRTIVRDLNQAGDSKVAFINFATQKESDGIGGDWHPSTKTHQIMAEMLVESLKQDIGW